MKTIIITGAGSGIGRSTTQLFLDEGWEVGLVGRRRETLEETAAGRAGALVLPCDVTDETQLEAGFARASSAAARSTSETPRPRWEAWLLRGLPQADGNMAVEPMMDVENVACSVLHMASVPLEANVQFMTGLATDLPFIGRG